MSNIIKRKLNKKIKNSVIKTEQQPIIINKNIDEKEKKEEIKNSKYCSIQLGKLLYTDKLLSIDRVIAIQGILRKYESNTKYNEEILNDLNKYKKDGIISNIISVERFLYSDDYMKFMSSIPLSGSNEFYICNGVTDVGYVEVSYNNCIISKDLRIYPEITIIKKDIMNPIVVFNRNPIRKLTYVDSEFMNKINFENKSNILLLGIDLGYILFLLKDKNVKNLYIYDKNEKLLKFIKEKFYDKIETDVNVHFIYEDIDDFNINDINNQLDLIVISSMIEIDEQILYYYKFKLYNYDSIVKINNKGVILNKFRHDLQDVIIIEKDKVISSMLEDFNDTRGIYSGILGVQLDFVEKAAQYLDENNIFFNSYKTFQRFINNNETILNILKLE